VDVNPFSTTSSPTVSRFPKCWADMPRHTVTGSSSGGALSIAERRPLIAALARSMSAFGASTFWPRRCLFINS
jgi:hypothetical protein